MSSVSSAGSSSDHGTNRDFEEEDTGAAYHQFQQHRYRYPYQPRRRVRVMSRPTEQYARGSRTDAYTPRPAPASYAQQGYGDQLARVSSFRSARASSLSSRSRSPRRERRRRRSRSRSRSRDRRDSKPEEPPPPPVEKAWYKKKSLWATMGSVAALCALMPMTMSANATKASAKATTTSAMATRESAQATKSSANATRESANATRESANATNRAADAAFRSAKAAERSANAVEKSANAVINTAVAQGHMDHSGRYIPPLKGQGQGPPPPPPPSSYYQGRGRRDYGVEYEPLRAAMNSADMAKGYIKVS